MIGNFTSKIFLRAFTLQLKLIHDPLTKHTQPKHLPSGLKPTKGSDYWASFPISSEVSLQARVYLLELGTSATQHEALIETTFTGIILGESHHVGENPDTFIMVTRDVGESLERIGHVILGRGHVRIVNKVSTETVSYMPDQDIFQAYFGCQEQRLVCLA